MINLPLREAVTQFTAVYRHPVSVRLFHWINVVCFVILLMSGLQIFNSYPRLHWGYDGYDSMPAVFEIGAAPDLKHQQGWVLWGSHRINTTGIFGVAYRDPDPEAHGAVVISAFPRWMTLPSTLGDLGSGRGWHFLMIWVFVVNWAIYCVSGLVSRRISKLFPTRSQWQPRAIARDVWMHFRLRHSVGADALSYNFLQKLAYLMVLFILFPAMILTGMTMSPSALAAFPWLIDLFQGRQTARTLHFIVANALVVFLLVHVFQLFVAGFVNEMRSMITGYFVPPEESQK